jgi:hypothetical protein
MLLNDQPPGNPPRAAVLHKLAGILNDAHIPAPQCVRSALQDGTVRPEDLGLTAAEARRRWPQAVEYTALDGGPCWRLEDLRD